MSYTFVAASVISILFAKDTVADTDLDIRTDCSNKGRMRFKSFIAMMKMMTTILMTTKLLKLLLSFEVYCNTRVCCECYIEFC